MVCDVWKPRIHLGMLILDPMVLVAVAVGLWPGLCVVVELLPMVGVPLVLLMVTRASLPLSITLVSHARPSPMVSMFAMKLRLMLFKRKGVPLTPMFFVDRLFTSVRLVLVGPFPGICNSMHI
jgi:hypothetical protein